MNHRQALETAAAERYTLNEMTAVERDEFEEHYFDCLECANDVRDYAAFAQSSRATARPGVPAPATEQAPAAARGGWRRAFHIPATAAASLLVFFAVDGWQDRQPRIEVAAVRLELQNVSRSEAVEPQAAPAGRRFDVTVDVNMEGAASYRAEMRDARGRVAAAEDITLQQAAETVSLRVGPLPAGRYELVTLGVRKDGNRSEIARYPFIVRGP